ncbi:MAG: LuxR C-terminal-related transcriptional regulator [Microthrixaceae bacterium]
MRLLIIDGQQMFADCLARYLDDATDVEVTSTCYSLAEVPAALGCARPDIVVTGWQLPDGNGRDVIETVRSRTGASDVVGDLVVGDLVVGDLVVVDPGIEDPAIEDPGVQDPGVETSGTGDPAPPRGGEPAPLPETAPRVVVLTGFGTDEVIQDAMGAGCDGFVTKDRSPEVLLEALRAALRGEVLLTPETIAGLRSPIATRSPAQAALELKLSDREVQVITLLAEARTNADIAAALFLSTNTVRNHVARIAAKLGVSTRMEIVLRSAEVGVISLDAESTRPDIHLI